MFSRFTEGSSWAGIAAIIHSVAALVASQGTDATAWGALVAGLAAIIIPEKKGE